MAQGAGRLGLWFRVDAELLVALAQMPQFSTQNKNTDGLSPFLPELSISH